MHIHCHLNHGVHSHLHGNIIIMYVRGVYVLIKHSSYPARACAARGYAIGRGVYIYIYIL